MYNYASFKDSDESHLITPTVSGTEETICCRMMTSPVHL